MTVSAVYYCRQEQENALIRATEKTTDILNAIDLLENGSGGITVTKDRSTYFCKLTQIYYAESVDKHTYIYTKRLSVDMNADLAVFSELTSLMEDLTDTLYDVEFALSDEAEKEKQVISAAIANSRDKAEFIASSLGKSIKGVDEVSYEQPTSDLYRCLAKSADGMNCNSLESMIKLPTKMISKTIDIDWIID